MKVWCTKYFITKGEITEHNSELYDGLYVNLDWPGGLNDKLLVKLGKEAFLSREEAVRQAQKMIESKRNSIKKQLKKLTDLEKSLK